MSQGRTFLAMLVGAAIVVVSPMAWRRFARATMTQVHRINQ